MWKSVDQVGKAEGVSRQTIGRWIREGRYENIKKTEGGHYRIWVEEDHLVLLYARVSTSKQNSSLERQVEILKEEVI